MDAQAIEFVETFRELRRLSGGDPAELCRRCRDDRELYDKVVTLIVLDSVLNESESDAHTAYISPVNPDYRETRDLYAAEWSHAIGHIFLFGDDLSAKIPTHRERKQAKDAYPRKIASEKSRAVSEMLWFVKDQLQDGYRADALGELADAISDAARYLDAFFSKDVFDFEGFERRRRAIRTVLVPPHVDAKHGGEAASLKTNLVEAYRAYLFGLPRSSLVMCRSLLEILLNEHYKVARPESQKSWNLEDKINAFESHNYKVNREALHKVRKWADDILHQTEDRGRKYDWAPQWEESVRSSLEAIRVLIENCPHVEGPSRG